jgi:GH24 family phage-related lysozyme (muramidase)
MSLLLQLLLIMPGLALLCAVAPSNTGAVSCQNNLVYGQYASCTQTCIVDYQLGQDGVVSSSAALQAQNKCIQQCSGTPQCVADGCNSVPSNPCTTFDLQDAQLDATGESFIQSYEGFAPYFYAIKGDLTVCYGHDCSTSETGCSGTMLADSPFTQSYCQILFEEDSNQLKALMIAALGNPAGLVLTQNQFNVLMDLVYNHGPNALTSLYNLLISQAAVHPNVMIDLQTFATAVSHVKHDKSKGAASRSAAQEDLALQCTPLGEMYPTEQVDGTFCRHRDDDSVTGVCLYRPMYPEVDGKYYDNSKAQDCNPLYTDVQCCIGCTYSVV